MGHLRGDHIVAATMLDSVCRAFPLPQKVLDSAALAPLLLLFLLSATFLLITSTSEFVGSKFWGRSKRKEMYHWFFYLLVAPDKINAVWK